MTFTSNIFLVGLLPWLILAVYLTRKQKYAKRVLLILTNSLFYIWGGIGAFFFVCCFTLCVWLFCRIINKNKNKLFLALFISMTISPLLAVKYTGFIIDNINSFFHYSIVYQNMTMPIGISFFTFEAISLLCDTYFDKLNNTISLADTYMYLTFFPTVTSGPIIRFHDFKNGLSNEINITAYNSSIERIAIGLCKKVLIADKIASLADYYFEGVASGNTYSCIGLWIGSITYTLQLYFDFSGYSDMAIGIGNLLGFKINENFNKPYQAVSISDFWKRWHISLSQWFRDYIYIPLGGNRCSVPTHITNLLIVWILTGIWHGADWSFIIWGLGYFVLLTLEKYIPFIKSKTSKWIGHIYTLFFINLLWIPFRAGNLKIAVKYIAGMFGIASTGRIESKAIAFTPYLIAAITLCFPWEKLLNKQKEKLWYTLIKGAFIILFFVLAICAVTNATYTPYIYGNF